MGLVIDFCLLVRDSTTNIYTPVWWNSEISDFVIYDKPNLPPTEDESFDIGELYHEFGLLSIEKPYPLSYYLSGVGSPFRKYNMKRYNGRGMSGIPKNTHLHFRATLNPTENNCVSLVLADLVQEKFNVPYSIDDAEQNLADYPPTHDLAKLLGEINDRFSDYTRPSDLLVVVRDW